jgi:hypothetical protein
MNVTPEPQPAHVGLEWEKLLGIDPSAERLPESSAEILRHQASIRTMAEEFNRPLEEVAYFYREELARLRSRAAIADYLPVLVSKKIREHYRNTPEHGRARSPPGDGGA